MLTLNNRIRYGSVCIAMIESSVAASHASHIELDDGMRACKCRRPQVRRRAGVAVMLGGKNAMENAQ